MKIRAHKGGYAESMATVREIPPTPAAVREYLVEHGAPPRGAVDVISYGVDSRNGWNTHIVLLDGAPWAFCDQQLEGVMTLA